MDMHTQIPENDALNMDPPQEKYIDEELDQLKENFEHMKEWRKQCIYRVPWWLKGQCDDKHFRPRFVSIGPYHWGDSKLERMQLHKYRVLDSVLAHTEKDLSQVVDAVKNLETQARACYENLPDMSSEAFVKMLVLDACFVVHLHNVYNCSDETYRGYPYKEDQIFSKNYILNGSLMDLMLLENQIPICILQVVYNILFDDPQNDGLVDLLFKSLGSDWVTGSPDPRSVVISSTRIQISDNNNNMESCLEVFWHSLMYDSTTSDFSTRAIDQRINLWGSPGINLKQYEIPSVTTLVEAGVKFRYKNSAPFWDIEFIKGVMYIPQIMLYEFSESMFIKLMAFELLHHEEDKYKIISYVNFMDSLVNSASDAAALRERDIIVCASPSDKEVAALFNRLGKQVLLPFDQYKPSQQFADLSKQIYVHRVKKKNIWRATLMHNYFNNPWAIISVIAASFLLILTIMQTSYTVAPYYNRK